MLGSSATTVVMGGMCAASVRCYAAALAAGTLMVDLDERRLPLRHSHHRYRIDGPNGVQTLTVPLVGSTNNMMTPLRDVLISEHGDWRRLHWGALFSAYGRSPYFDYVADDLSRVIHGGQRYLHEFNRGLHEVIVDFMDLPLATRYLAAGDDVGGPVEDLRGKMGMKKPDAMPIDDVPYYQMWTGQATGFCPGLSILDLMMNMGREGVITLLEMARSLKS
ncbi:MAG: WbqC family protein [Muribaculaceae bacterium]|nr:WbqC family protein [Muribaculaceae bacterium]